MIHQFSSDILELVNQEYTLLQHAIGVEIPPSEDCCIVGFRSSVGRRDSESIRDLIVSHFRHAYPTMGMEFSISAQAISHGDCDYYFIKCTPDNLDHDALFPSEGEDETQDAGTILTQAIQ